MDKAAVTLPYSGKISLLSGKFLCEFCGYVTSDNFTLNKHFQTSHVAKVSSMSEDCINDSIGKLATNKKNLNRKDLFEIVLECVECGFRCLSKTDFLEHQMEGHPTVEKCTKLYFHQCKYCDFNAASASVLRKHEERHVGKKFKCDKCDHLANSYKMLPHHMVKHTEKKTEYTKQKKTESENEKSVNGNLISSKTEAQLATFNMSKPEEIVSCDGKSDKGIQGERNAVPETSQCIDVTLQQMGIIKVEEDLGEGRKKIHILKEDGKLYYGERQHFANIKQGNNENVVEHLESNEEQSEEQSLHIKEEPVGSGCIEENHKIKEQIHIKEEPLDLEEFFHKEHSEETASRVEKVEDYGKGVSVQEGHCNEEESRKYEQVNIKEEPNDTEELFNKECLKETTSREEKMQQVVEQEEPCNTEEDISCEEQQYHITEEQIDYDKIKFNMSQGDVHNESIKEVRIKEEVTDMEYHTNQQLYFRYAECSSKFNIASIEASDLDTISDESRTVVTGIEQTMDEEQTDVPNVLVQQCDKVIMVKDIDRRYVKTQTEELVSQVNSIPVSLERPGAVESKLCLGPNSGNTEKTSKNKQPKSKLLGKRKETKCRPNIKPNKWQKLCIESYKHSVQKNGAETEQDEHDLKSPVGKNTNQRISAIKSRNEPAKTDEDDHDEKSPAGKNIYQLISDKKSRNGQAKTDQDDNDEKSPAEKNLYQLISALISRNERVKTEQDDHAVKSPVVKNANQEINAIKSRNGQAKTEQDDNNEKSPVGKNANQRSNAIKSRKGRAKTEQNDHAVKSPVGKNANQRSNAMKSRNRRAKTEQDCHNVKSPVGKKANQRSNAIKSKNGQKRIKADYYDIQDISNVYVSTGKRTSKTIKSNAEAKRRGIESNQTAEKGDNVGLSVSSESSFTERQNLKTASRRSWRAKKEYCDKRYECEYCGFISYLPNLYQIHLMKHTGQLPFKCRYCSFSTVFSSSFTQHFQLHTGKKFKCAICGILVHSWDELPHHIKLHHSHQGDKKTA